MTIKICFAEFIDFLLSVPSEQKNRINQQTE